MKEKHVRHKEKNKPGLKQPSLPGVITCTKCGFDMELWTDEYETRCMNCGHKFFRRESTVH